MEKLKELNLDKNSRVVMVTLFNSALRLHYNVQRLKEEYSKLSSASLISLDILIDGLRTSQDYQLLGEKLAISVINDALVSNPKTMWEYRLILHKENLVISNNKLYISLTNTLVERLAIDYNIRIDNLILINTAITNFTLVEVDIYGNVQIQYFNLDKSFNQILTIIVYDEDVAFYSPYEEKARFISRKTIRESINNELNFNRNEVTCSFINVDDLKFDLLIYYLRDYCLVNDIKYIVIGYQDLSLLTDDLLNNIRDIFKSRDISLVSYDLTKTNSRTYKMELEFLNELIKAQLSKFSTKNTKKIYLS